jgi:predicted nucleic acid-binding protein
VNKVFIDSNVILYLLSGDAVKADLAEYLLGKGATISVQVLNEVTSVCSRKLKMTWEEIDVVLLSVKAACNVVPLTLESHDRAVEISRRYQISFYDAHICASAILSGAKITLSEDMQDGMKIDGMTIRNPFN